MATGQITVNVSAGGTTVGPLTLSQTGTTARHDDLSGDDALSAATTDATLTTRSSDYAGVLTLGAGHGLTTDDSVHVYYAAGTYSYGYTISDTDETTITVTGGAGTVLPTQGDTITVAKAHKLEFAHDAADLKLLSVSANADGLAVFYDGDDSALLVVPLTDGQASLLYGASWWRDGSGTVATMSGTISYVMLSTSEASSANGHILAVIDTTP